MREVTVDPSVGKRDFIIDGPEVNTWFAVTGVNDDGDKDYNANRMMWSCTVSLTVLGKRVGVQRFLASRRPDSHGVASASITEVWETFGLERLCARMVDRVTAFVEDVSGLFRKYDDLVRSGADGEPSILTKTAFDDLVYLRDVCMDTDIFGSWSAVLNQVMVPVTEVHPGMVVRKWSKVAPYAYDTITSVKRDGDQIAVTYGNSFHPEWRDAGSRLDVVVTG